MDQDPADVICMSIPLFDFFKSIVIIDAELQVVGADHDLLFATDEPRGSYWGLADFDGFDRGLLFVIIDGNVAGVQSNQQPRQLLVELRCLHSLRTSHKFLP